MRKMKTKTKISSLMSTPTTTKMTTMTEMTTTVNHPWKTHMIQQLRKFQTSLTKTPRQHRLLNLHHKIEEWTNKMQKSITRQMIPKIKMDKKKKSRRNLFHQMTSNI